ncbi:hypothetical protein SORBI_3003G067400 [Sorghum bicolor]|jgi:hypothetical protein|uniref:Secreted protein n=1 Tax=Sorghum bicolor TaxID=4558 RepID=A0A1B6Q1Q1_SORBI|nr:hypothetical protein SORBI_3003G067400 [Sorghum bicolor]
MLFFWVASWLALEPMYRLGIPTCLAPVISGSYSSSMFVGHSSESQLHGAFHFLQAILKKNKIAGKLSSCPSPTFSIDVHCYSFCRDVFPATDVLLSAKFQEYYFLCYSS